MPLRLLLILTFIAQQLALPAAVALDWQAEDCLATSCCRVIEVNTCCGIVVKEMQCGKTGGDCRCGIEDRESDPVPATPVPTESQDLIPVLSSPKHALINSTIASHSQPRWDAPIISRTHNQAQATLCIWRT